ncbi:MAG: NAD-dependent succinate-semialdehyde dehydrogenase [Cytophagaceae bacterium]|nr:NAD-dependent succinate-semialdehyde dehydrogenase [Cytophagaceae bacterium]
MLRSINPYSGELVAEYKPLTSPEIRQKLDRAEQTFKDWRKTPLPHRADLLRATAAVLTRRRDELAGLITQEMGKTLREARGEVEKCALGCVWYAEHGDEILRPQSHESDAKTKSYVRYDPIGPVLAVMPWNFPFWQVMRFAAPALMAGNVGLLKHASNVSGCSLALESVFREAGFPEGCFQSLLIDAKTASGLIADPIVRAVTLTGSEKAGSEVAAAAGRAIKKTVLELGGSDPFIVLADADIEEAANVARQSRLQNAGQSCIAAKRFIIVKDTYDNFVEAFIRGLGEYQPGDPLLDTTKMGPMARPDLAEDLDNQVRQSLKQGARQAAGGPRDKCLMPPVVLTGVQPGMAAFDEETFGPLAAMISARDEDHAIQLANQSRYGLGAAVWSRDLERAQQVATHIESGNVFINAMVKSVPSLPFGGVKQSGYGRELSALGPREFMNIKTV